jgi:hypothetical protein
VPADLHALRVSRPAARARRRGSAAGAAAERHAHRRGVSSTVSPLLRNSARLPRRCHAPWPRTRRPPRSRTPSGDRMSNRCVATPTRSDSAVRRRAACGVLAAGRSRAACMVRSVPASASPSDGYGRARDQTGVVATAIVFPGRVIVRRPLRGQTRSRAVTLLVSRPQERTAPAGGELRMDRARRDEGDAEGVWGRWSRRREARPAGRRWRPAGLAGGAARAKASIAVSGARAVARVPSTSKGA